MATWPLLKTGSTGENVRTAQYLLNAGGASLTVDGDFGALTKGAVEQFQTDHGLTADGVVGDKTWPTLIVEVKSGSTGDAVKAVQSQIKSRSGSLAVDGSFGPVTDSAVRSFQGDIGLHVDGVVGPLTWNAFVDRFLASIDALSAARAMFDAWTRHDQVGAAKDATPSAVNALFAQSFSASDGWTFSGSSGAAGSVGVEWTGRVGGKIHHSTTLILQVNNNAGTPFFFVEAVFFQVN